jgi:hypothetical protein
MSRGKSARQLLAWWEALRDERFEFQHEGHTYVWNISKAWRFIQESPREPDYFRPAEQGVTIEHLQERYPSLDWEYAKTTDLSRPLLFVPYRGQAQLADGWHRVARAVLEGIEELPAYLLTDEEANACLLLHLPPGDVGKGG